jgi:hypothetical protein
MSLQQHEAPINLEEQLAMSDSQLALTGIARSMELAEKEVTSATHGLNFEIGYKPSAPTAPPAEGPGSLDYQDWYVETHADDDYDKESEVMRREEDLDKAHDVLGGLSSDKNAVEAGEEEVIAKYAQAERERIQKEIEKQQAAKDSAERYKAYKNGTEIIGAGQLIDSVNGLLSDPSLAEAHNKTTESGWKYLGDYSVYPAGKRSVFTRAFEDGKLPYKSKELLSLEVSEEGITVQYSDVDNIDETAVNRYGKDIATGNHYSFRIHGSGKVGEQKHTTGPVSKHLPHLMDNGTVQAGYIHDPESSHSYGSTDLLTTEDMTVMQTKIAEVTAAMQEVASK